MLLNEAIFRVITTQFKKDMDGADKVVDLAGYIVTKNDGRFEVRTPRENGYAREISFRDNRYNGYRLVTWNGYTQKEYRYETIEDLKKFDFTGFLNKPINYGYAEVVNKYVYEHCGRTDTQRKIDRIRSQKNCIRGKENDIKRIKREILELQEKLENAITWKVKYENELNVIRKELNLKNK